MKTISLITIIGTCFAAASFADDASPMLKGEAIARAIRDELRLLDAATDQVGIEGNFPTGTTVSPDQLRPHMRADIRLNLAFSNSAGFSDLLGHAYGPFVINERPHVPRATFDALKKFVSDDFWKPYTPK